MNLTSNDLNEIRNIIDSAFFKQNNEMIAPMQDELEALRNDIKDIYGMLDEVQNKLAPDSRFEKMNIEQKPLKLNAELLAAAKQVGISLPR